MKSLLVATALLAAPTMLQTDTAQASPIARCARNGGVVYTDKACKAIGARALPMSSELIRGLARIEATEPVDAGGALPTEDTEQMENAQAYLAARRNTGCARSPEQLALQLRGAVAMGDVNRIAAAYNWAGMRSNQAAGVLAKLEALGREEVTSANYYNATFGDAALATMMPTALRSSGGNGPAGFLQLVQNGGTSVTEFDVHRMAGCYFVSF